MHGHYISFILYNVLYHIQFIILLVVLIKIIINSILAIIYLNKQVLKPD